MTKQPTLDQRLALAALRNERTAACNGRGDCTSAVHLSVCPRHKPK